MSGRNKTIGFIATFITVSLMMNMLSINPLKYLFTKLLGKLFFKNILLATVIQCKM